MIGPEPVSHRGAAVFGLVLFLVASAFALSADVPRATYGLKSDESTYIAQALSLAYDGDLTYERHDLERFAGLYHSGPEGIFLKRGKQLRLRTGGGAPFVRLQKRDDPAARLYFGKSFAYPVLAAPFVRLFGLNGLLLLQVVLGCVAAAAAYRFLAAQMAPLSALTFASAFFGASALPVYAAFLMPELFNFTLVLLAYFCWLYKEVAPASRWSARWTDLAAVVLLGVATYSKPLPTAILVAPIVALAWTRRAWVRGCALGALAVAVTAGLFAMNAAISGEFNYQGGDRKTFYGRFPFETPEATWESFRTAVQTDGTAAQQVMTSGDAAGWFVHNVQYFFVGRHFGFVPYFFPGVLAIALWLASPQRRDLWRLLVALAFLASALALVVVLPFTWSGGGGPPGNRYGLTAYAVLLFVLPPARTAAAGVAAWAGGALFTAKILASPFAAAKYPYLLAEKGPLRRLPVELTMPNDLPVMLAQPLRGHVQYRLDPGVLLYFLDQNSWPPEPNGLWISGSGRTNIIVRSAWPIESLEMEAESPIRTTLSVSVGAESVTTSIEPGTVSRFTIRASGVHGFNDYNYLMEARSTEAFVPHLLEPANMDFRNLGVQLRFRPLLVGKGAVSQTSR